MPNDGSSGNFFTATLVAIWDLTAEMAPYLLFGFAIAGLLHLLIRREWVERFLGKPGLGGAVKGALVGVPMPLCSCSVIPVAASLRERGASRGATASFLSSTPQTGVDSILATYALMGGAFTAIRVVVAMATGVITGLLVDLFSQPKSSTAGVPEPSRESAPSGCCAGGAKQAETDPCCDSGSGAGDCCGGEPEPDKSRSFGAAVRYGFLTLPADLAVALLTGLVLAGLITVLLPADLLTGAWSGGALAFLMATVISLPLYVCATASIPMAFALIAAGLSPGTALVFLIMGPATNTATIVTVVKMLGKSATVIYLVSLLTISWLAGWGVNLLLDPAILDAQMAEHDHAGIAAWQHVSAAVLLALLGWGLVRERIGGIRGDADEGAACCHGE